MGIYQRLPRSPYWWLLLERPGQKAIRESSRIPIKGGTDFQTRENKKLAEEAYAVRMGDLARQRYQLPTPRLSIGFREYRKWYLDHVSVHKRNYTGEKSMLNRLGEFFDHLDLTAITRETAQEWLTMRKRQVATATVKREFELLRAVLGSAIPKYFEAHPLKGFPGKGQLRIVELEPRVMDPDEETRLIAALDDPEDRALVLLAIDTLMRLSDLANLRRRDDHGAYITVPDPKVKRYQIPVSKRARKAIDALPATKSPWVFPKYHHWTDGRDRERGGHRGAQMAVIRMFKEACIAAGLPHGRKAKTKDGRPGLTFHSLRHTGATRALERGASLRTVQELGGWTNLKQLQRYAHVTEDAKQRAVDSIGKKLRKRAAVAIRRTPKKRKAS